jgi:glycerophosphoryl diester phosphodiesterase
MAAFSRAVEFGYKYLETDAHVTADGVLVALHDATLDRVTDRSGVIEALPWREIRTARIAGVEPIPLLADVLTSWPHVRVNIDPKSDRAVAPLIELIRRTGVLDRVCVGSFSHRRLRRIRAALGPRLCTSMSPYEVLRLRLAASGLAPRSAVATAPNCTQIPARQGRIMLAEPRLLRCAHALGLQVHVWTINDRAQMEALLDLGVDGLISDNLADLRAVLERRGQWQSPAAAT